MTSSPNPPSSANPEDPWDQLAEDLWGLEYGKEHAARETTPPAVEPAPQAAREPRQIVGEPRGEAESAASARPEPPPQFAAENLEEEDVPSSFDEPEETVEPTEGAAGDPQR